MIIKVLVTEKSKSWKHLMKILVKIYGFRMNWRLFSFLSVAYWTTCSVQPPCCHCVVASITVAVFIAIDIIESDLSNNIFVSPEGADPVKDWKQLWVRQRTLYS